MLVREDKVGKRKTDHEFSVRHAFIDNSFDEGEIFCRQLLQSGDFSSETLKYFALSGHKSSKKPELASHITERLMIGNLDPRSLITVWAKEPRSWLTLKTGNYKPARHAYGDAMALLSQFGPDTDLHGPFDDGDASYYVATNRVTHVTVGGDGQVVRYKIRWHAFARLQGSVMSIHWNGLTLNDDEERPHAAGGEHAYWRDIPKLAGWIDANHVATDAEYPNLSEILLHDAMDDFVNAPDVDWRPRGVRADNAGVAVNARSSAVDSIDRAGLGALAREVARVAIDATGLNASETEYSQAQSAVLKMLIREWGTRSHEFSVDGSDVRFRGNAYFGLCEDADTKDSFPHIRCYKNYGGSNGALEFIKNYLGDEGG